jgi:hypothetical protein
MTPKCICTVKHTNPKAYGYPEIVHWQQSYTTTQCPICSRMIEEVT